MCQDKPYLSGYQLSPLAHYINHAEVGHNGFEFILSFGQALDGQKELIHTRFGATPYIAKSLWLTLGESISKYELSFGEIPTDQGAE